MDMTEHDQITECFDVCEQFAAIHGIPVDYVWQEFVDPGFASLDEIEQILGAYN